MTTAMTHPERLKTLQGYLETKRDVLVRIAPKGSDVERIMRVALFEAAKNEKLSQCSPVSVYLSLAKACELDLVAGGVLHRCSLVPRWNKGKSTFEADLMIEYTGLMDLVRRSGEVKNFTARCVRENEEFSHSFSLDGGEMLHHEPCYEGDPGELRMAYAVCEFKDGSKQVEVMRRDQVEAVKRCSRYSGQGPWVEHTEEMWRKTVIRRICKYLPLTPQAKAVLEHDINVEYGDGTNPFVSENLEKELQEVAGDKTVIDVSSDNAEFDPIGVFDSDGEKPKSRASVAVKNAKTTSEKE